MAVENRIDGMRPDAPELAPFGPLAIGVTTVELTNPDQIDVVNASDGNLPRRDRRLVVETWYPAAGNAFGGTYENVILRDGRKTANLHGRAVRNAPPLRPSTGDGYPLIIISHGYPGNRFLMSHLAENLATKGFVVAAIDHRDSTYDDPAYLAGNGFGSTLVNRSLDQLFVLDEMARLSGEAGLLDGMVDADKTGIIGYSMGGYGALVTAGAGVSAAAVEMASDMEGGAPDGLLAMHLAGSDSHKALLDARVRAVMPFAPWGMQRGIWDAAALANVTLPVLLVAGSRDETSGHEDGVKAIFEGLVNCDRRLLTFELAGHNVAAPIPAPLESMERVNWLDFVPFEHYADPVWDTVRMNNIAQHYATAFFSCYLKHESEMAAHLKPGTPLVGISIEA
ncbi:MAG: dienelactone hydrolase [Nitratireductor sp.]|nr:dienelactone hydrolase [Nitratireductor sp.]